MAVLDRAWRRWGGRVTPLYGRFSVITRYELADVFASRVFLAFYVLCFLPSLAALIAIYLSHNTALLEQAPGISEWLTRIPEWIFLHLFGWQAAPAFFLAVIVAPTLIAVDTNNNGLTLILARPVTRRGYVCGKMTVLLVLLSPVTWIPALLIFGLQAGLAGGSWGWENARIPFAYLLGHLVWIVVVSLLGLAVSAVVRFTALARAALLALFLVSAVSGGIVNQITRTSIGDLLHLPRAIVSVVLALFGAATPSGLPGIFNWMTLGAVAVLSLLFLRRRLKACEEVS